MSPPIGGRASDGSCETADTIWLSSPTTGPPTVRPGRSSPPQALGDGRAGDPVRGRVEPDERHRAAAVGAFRGHDAVAGRGQGSAAR